MECTSDKWKRKAQQQTQNSVGDEGEANVEPKAATAYEDDGGASGGSEMLKKCCCTLTKSLVLNNNSRNGNKN